AYHPALPSFPTRRSSDLEVRHVVADRVVVPAVVRRRLVAAVTEHVEHRAQPGRELPVEREDVLARGREVLPLLGAHADVERDARSEEHTSELQSPDTVVC